MKLFLLLLTIFFAVAVTNAQAKKVFPYPYKTSKICRTVCALLPCRLIFRILFRFILSSAQVRATKSRREKAVTHIFLSI